jgi:hypothetical protein
MDHVFLPFRHLQGHLSGEIAFLPLVEVEDEREPGVINAHIKFLDGVEDAVAVLNGHSVAEG